MDKLEFINQSPPACQDGIDAFMAFEGTISDYFLNHERGRKAYVWCHANGWKVMPILPQLGVFAREGATVTLPACQSVEGDVVAREGATIRIPKGCRVGGTIDGDIQYI